MIEWSSDQNYWMENKKGSESVQVSIEVNDCIFPHHLPHHLPYQQYSLLARIGNFHPSDSRMAASTAWKCKQGNVVSFATKLYLKTQKDTLQAHPICFISIFASTPQGKTEIAKGEANPLKEDEQSLKLQVNKDQSDFIEVQLQFRIIGCENKSNNTKLNELKSRKHVFLSPQQKKALESNPQGSTTNDSKALLSLKTQDKCSKPPNVRLKSKPYIPSNKNPAIQIQQSARRCKHLLSIQSDGLTSCKSKKTQNTNKCASPLFKKPQIPRIPTDQRSPRTLKSPANIKLKQSAKDRKEGEDKSDASSLGSVTMELDILVEPNSLPIYSRSRQ